MEISLLERIFLESIQRLRDERSDRSLYHVFQGKKSATSLQDAHFYDLESTFGTVLVSKQRFESVLTELAQKKWIERQETLRLTSEGARLVGQTDGVIIDQLGGELRGYAEMMWKRLSLLVQTVICLEAQQPFIPVQQETIVREWVKSVLPTISNRADWLAQMYQELTLLLERLPERDATLISHRLSGVQTGWSYPQLARMMKVDVETVQFEFIIAWRRCINDLKSTPLIQQIGAGLHTPKMTQSAQTTWELLQQGLTVEDVAVRRRLKNSTMEDHLVEIAMYAPTFPLDHFVDTAQQEEIRHIAQQFKTYALKRIKSAMQSDVSYFQIRLVLARSKWEGS